ncbi:uncharacterized protein LOC125221577 isoform X2 [Salvia hispanica]|uniref:uncharacterized protein LOC125221577 isoform X2 n=1 Tax=Salvia hispanica TaxID=49212 RepID=UPI002008FF2D|nr:uncharacterized protein LOC125221577 isoform X2 [Salvia hispanica]
MMAHLHHNLSIVAKGSGQELFWRCRGMVLCNIGLGLANQRRGRSIKNRGLIHCCNSSTSTEVTLSYDKVNSAYEKLGSAINEHHVSSAYEKLDSTITEGDFVRQGNWKVRRMLETEEEMRQVAYVQAEAFHEPAFFFDDVFFDFFKAEVLSGLMYRLRNSPPDRYACLVAEPRDEFQDSKKELAGVVDVTVLREDSVLKHLLGAKEYIYVSGIAVLNRFRRQKVATTLLEACDAISAGWGFDYLVLRAYEDDHGARKLYSNAGYKVVSEDPPWTTSWVGRRRRVVMVKYVGDLVSHFATKSSEVKNCI